MNLYPLIAKKIARNPVLIDEALAIVEHWAATGAAPPDRLAEWHRILERAKKNTSGKTALLRLLRDDSEKSRRLKDFGPFAGIVPRHERRKVFLKCGFDH